MAMLTTRTRTGREEDEDMTNRKVALGTGILSAAGQRGADLFGEGVLSAGAGNRAAAGHGIGGTLGGALECISFKLDRHGGSDRGTDRWGRRRRRRREKSVAMSRAVARKIKYREASTSTAEVRLGASTARRARRRG